MPTGFKTSDQTRSHAPLPRISPGHRAVRRHIHTDRALVDDRFLPNTGSSSSHRSDRCRAYTQRGASCPAETPAIRHRRRNIAEHAGRSNHSFLRDSPAHAWPGNRRRGLPARFPACEGEARRPDNELFVARIRSSQSLALKEYARAPANIASPSSDGSSTPNWDTAIKPTTTAPAFLM